MNDTNLILKIFHSTVLAVIPTITTLTTGVIFLIPKWRTANAEAIVNAGVKVKCKVVIKTNHLWRSSFWYVDGLLDPLMATSG